MCLCSLICLISNLGWLQKSVSKCYSTLMRTVCKSILHTALSLDSGSHSFGATQGVNTEFIVFHYDIYWPDSTRSSHDWLKC